jgi:hypothetical protein
MDSNFYFLRAQIRAINPDWTQEQINEEVKKIMEEHGDWHDNEEDGCLYCGS